DRALRKPANALELRCLFLKDLHEQATDDLALAFWIGLAFERVQETIFGIHANDAHAHVLGEGLHDLIAFAVTEQAVIDEHARELIADRPMQKRSHDR